MTSQPTWRYLLQMSRFTGRYSVALELDTEAPEARAPVHSAPPGSLVFVRRRSEVGKLRPQRQPEPAQ